MSISRIGPRSLFNALTVAFVVATLLSEFPFQIEVRRVQQFCLLAFRLELLARRLEFAMQKLDIQSDTRANPWHEKAARLL